MRGSADDAEQTPDFCVSDNCCRAVSPEGDATDFGCSIAPNLLRNYNFLRSIFGSLAAAGIGITILCHLSVRGHQSEIVFGVLVVVLRRNEIPRPGFLLG
jgi:hypothetical protein